MANHNQVGNQGEDAAVFYLQDKGYCIHERNWHRGKFELDIVAEHEGELVFIEVKTRTSNRFGSPYEFIAARKKTNLIKAADCYICLQSIDLPIRFDILSVVYEGDRFHIEHIENAFTPSLNSRY